MRLHGYPLLFAALAAALLIGACGTGAAPADRGRESGRPSQPVPFQIGDRWRCPFGVNATVLSGRRLYRPLNFPGLSAGSITRPEHCYATVQEAVAAGYDLAPTPVGDLLVEGVYLVPTTSAVRGQCDAAARRLGFPVPCPGLLPTTTDRPTCERGCVFGSAFMLEFSGFLTPMSTSQPPHAYIIGTEQPGAYLRQYCDRSAADPFQDRAAPGRSGTTCPSGSALNSGHVLSWSTREHVLGIVSIHGATPTNVHLAQALAQRVYWSVP